MESNKNIKKAFVWNVVGSICNSGASLILLVFVTRVCGAYDAGIFSIAFATAQLMLTIGIFGMRAYQATDIHENIKFASYFTARIITCILMMGSSIIYILYSKVNREKGLIIFLVCLIKMVDALEDVFHALLQQRNKLDIAGKLLAVRNLLTIIIFGISLGITKNLIITCSLTAVISIVFCFVINIYSTYNIERIRIDFSFLPFKKLFIDCVPLFIGTFLSLYIYNIPKYAIDRYMTPDIQTYYGIIFMPAFVINMFSEFIFKPLLTLIATYWDQKKFTDFNKILFKLFGAIIVMTIGVIIGGYLLGVQVLSFVYGVDLYSFRRNLIILLLGGGFGAGVHLVYNVLTSIRKQAIVFIGYSVVALGTTIIAPKIVQLYGINGASIVYLISSISLFTIFVFSLILNIKINISE